MKRLSLILLMLALATTAYADNLSFSIITSTGDIPVTGMASYQIAERGDLSAWADLLWIAEDHSFALGVSARDARLRNLFPLIEGGGFCAYWSFQHECLKGRLYLINVSF